MELSNRVKGIKPSPTLAITAKAKQMKAEGLDVVGFGAGEPDFDTPENIKQACINSLLAGNTKYTPVPGTDGARDAVIAKLKRDQGLEYARNQIIISCGAKHTLYNIFQALVGPGDEVLIPAPYWVSYPDQVILASAEPVIVETSEANSFIPTVTELEKVTTERSKVLVLNSPSNPTGGAATRKQLEEIAKFAVQKDLIVISDEIYEKIVYDGFEFTSIAQLPGMPERTVLVNGLSKAYSMTGWRIGYAAAPANLVSAMNNIQSQSTSNPVSFIMPAVEEALNGPQDFIGMMVAEFDKRRVYMVDRLNAMDGVSCFKPQGAFYVFPNFSKLYGRKFKGKVIENSSDFADYLLGEAKVAIVSGNAFGADNYARLSYAIAMKNIEKGLDRIEAAIGALE
ncbi:MAG: pyridoxal phosphate-dependent aminotransferase [bacterium]|nr:MAG: pyridoxal phosphate-dependent aminotransferase [bacterium]